MPQIFDRSSNALARMSLILTGLIVIALGVTLDQLQRSPWVTKQGQRADQPVPFSHKHHVTGLGIQCQYCHTTVERSSYAGIPPTKTCMNCHAQIWTNAQLLEPVRQSWATGESIRWIRVHDLPDYVYFNHSIHVNKGIGCSSCHGRVDLMPIMYQENSLQMEWCLSCHRDPAKNLRPANQIYNMAWAGPSKGKPVWCGTTGDKDGTPTAQTVNCTTVNPGEVGARTASLDMLPPTDQPETHMLDVAAHPDGAAGPTGADNVSYTKFTNQEALGLFLLKQYHIRDPHELSSCETCHR
jgi:Cytochrome c7 and related cytochrome c